MTPEPTTTLNPCRKCGDDAIVHDQKLMLLEDAKMEFIVCCGTCNQKSGWKLTEAEAIASWNALNFKKP